MSLRRSGGGVLEALLLIGALVSLSGIALLVPLPWSVLVAVLLVAGELAVRRNLRAERGEDDSTR